MTSLNPLIPAHQRMELRQMDLGGGRHSSHTLFPPFGFIFCSMMPFFTELLLLLFKKHFNFSWRVVALHGCAAFCRAAT